MFLFSGKNKLATDYVSNYNSVREFFPADYHDSASYHHLITDTLSAQRADRQRLVQVLYEQNRLMCADDETFRNLDLLVQPNALAVVTGQQVGLLGGPLYTLYKALTTCKLADYLKQQFHRPVVPVFYLVSEDHDFDEVRWIGYLNLRSHFKKLSYDPHFVDARQPVSEIVLEQNFLAVLNALEANTPVSEFKPKIFNDLRNIYKPGTRFADAFAQWYSILLRKWGMIFLDASDPRIKHLALPIFSQEILENTSVNEIIKTNARLTELGYPLQLAVHDERPHIFILQEGRHSLQREKTGLRNLHDNTIYSPEELLTHHHLLSPKAALRPIVQNFLLPTFAYVAGPGEIAYWAQLKKAHLAFHLPMPLVVPRATVTLIEKKIGRHINRFGISLEELFADRIAVLQSKRKELMPKEITALFAGIKNALHQDWSKLQQYVLNIDQTLLPPTTKTHQQILRHLGQLENKIVTALEQKENISTEQLRIIDEALFPDGHAQERQLHLTPWLFKYDYSFIKTVYDAVNLFSQEHQILYL